MGMDGLPLVRLWRRNAARSSGDLSGTLLFSLGTSRGANRPGMSQYRAGHHGRTAARQTSSSAVDARHWMDGSRPAARSSKSKFMLPWSFRRSSRRKYMPQLQHNMWVVAAKSAVLSVITGAASGWSHRLRRPAVSAPHVTRSGSSALCRERPTARLFGMNHPDPGSRRSGCRHERVQRLAEFAALSRDRSAHLEHEQAKAELKV